MDQARRNHSVQYISYPAYPWHKLRKETPEVYESYVDLIPGEWTRVKLLSKMRKHGFMCMDKANNVGDQRPKIGSGSIRSYWSLDWAGTEAHFANLVVKEDQSGE